MKVLEVKNLKSHYPVKKSIFSRKKEVIRAVDNISFELFEGETLGIVGESGCGKSTLGKTILQLVPITSGDVYFKEKKISNLNNKNMKVVRKDFQMIFQDPYASLNSRKTIYQIVSEPLKIHKLYDKDSKKVVLKMLEKVGLNPAMAERYPHEFSGGQRQRIGIARALILNPKVIIADEPVSALDVSVQAQVLNLLQDLQEEFKLTYLFISHDLSVVKHISDRVAVMYLGNIVEIATKEELYSNPKHPYTQALLSVIPTTDRNNSNKPIELSGDVPSPKNPPKGCTFHTRCPFAMDICKRENPVQIEITKTHSVTCHLITDEKS